MTLQNLSISNKNPLNLFLKLLKFKIKGHKLLWVWLLAIRLTVDGLGQFDQTDTSIECESNWNYILINKRNWESTNYYIYHNNSKKVKLKAKKKKKESRIKWYTTHYIQSIYDYLISFTFKWPLFCFHSVVIMIHSSHKSSVNKSRVIWSNCNNLPM